MSGEIVHSHVLTVSGLRRAYNPGSKSIDQSAKRNVSGRQTISTTHEALILNDVVTPGWAYFENVDLTNYVEIGKDVTGTFHAAMKLLAGESISVRLALTAPYARANTAAVDLIYDIFDT